jgi:hypothetical protein
VEEEFAEVVDGVGDEGGDAEVVGAGLAVAEFEGADVDAGEVEEGVFVVGGEFVLRLSRVLVRDRDGWGCGWVWVWGTW